MEHKQLRHAPMLSRKHWPHREHNSASWLLACFIDVSMRFSDCVNSKWTSGNVWSGANLSFLQSDSVDVYSACWFFESYALSRQGVSIQQDHTMSAQARSSLTGATLLQDPSVTKGMMYTDEERTQLGVQGLLPPTVTTMQLELARFWNQPRCFKQRGVML